MSVATGMARGFVVLDENIQDLKQQLQSKSLKVIVPVYSRLTAPRLTKTYQNPVDWR